MRKVEKFLSLFALTGLILKYLGIAGGVTMFVLSMFLLIGLYVVFGFYIINDVSINRFKKNNISFWTGVTSWFSSLAIAIGLVGIVFFIQHWPTYLGVGFIATCFVGVMFIINLVLYAGKHLLVYKASLLRISMVLGILTFLGVFYYYLIYFF